MQHIRAVVVTLYLLAVKNGAVVVTLYLLAVKNGAVVVTLYLLAVKNGAVVYGKLLRLARDYGALAFLDFNWGSAHGRIYVRLKRNSAQGNQFLQFCTGYDGRTYVGTHLLQIFNKDNPGECIIVGENDPKQPLSASLTNIGYSSNGQYSRPWSPGLVWGGWGTCSTQFGITLRHWTGGLPAPSCFGWIESGLEILQSAVLHPNISQVKVVDCGVVIS
ncbi:hypothetical protein Hamer_G013153 [Homarus americanus]|uniref:Uncharacterized protein n=1 Tax=Homarus americanus TaxID=6706 RepID=A0A8J5JXX2_HOMAM|nr:hypothetical protein Hamer_G013153 [Homarus americanus]